MTRNWLLLLPCALGALGLFSSRRAGDGTAGFYITTALTAAVYAAGAVVVSRIPALAGPAAELLDTPDKGGYTPTLLVLVINGIGEELVYRDAVPRQLAARGQTLVRAGVWSTVIYCLVTAVMGVPLLVFAAAVLGAVVYAEAVRTGRLHGPIATHLVWSVGMLFVLPHFF